MNFATLYTRKEERTHNWATFNDKPTMTQQSDANETDINVIMKRYTATGQLPHQLTQPLFGDFTEVPDYAQAVTVIRAAEEAFMQIPAEVRKRFGNDPGEFIKFASNPENKEELTKLGLTATPEPKTIHEQTLEAIKDLKPKEPPNGN